MAKHIETVCKYYIAFGICQKGKDACQEHYCQKCNKYEPRVRERHINQKKKRLDEIRKKEDFD